MATSGFSEFEKISDLAFVHMRATESPNIAAGRVVLFNGPPSSGKTSLVEALQRQLAAPWFHLSLDDFRSGISPRWWLEDNGTLFERLMGGHLRSLREMGLSGIDVLAEAVITPARRREYQAIFIDLPIVLIGVTCPVEVAREREEGRIDRRRGPIALGAEEFAAVHAGLAYDYEVSTTTGDPAQLALELATKLDALNPSSFKRHLR